MAFSLQHDAADIKPDMLVSLYTACNRVTASGHVLGAEQTINADQAVNALTLFASYQICEDLLKGSLTPGKRADFVILNKNPLELSDANLKDLQVLMTVKDDVVRYKR
jgi:predicted amidohydrolase YtcJ